MSINGTSFPAGTRFMGISRVAGARGGCFINLGLVAGRKLDPTTTCGTRLGGGHAR